MSQGDQSGKLRARVAAVEPDVSVDAVVEVVADAAQEAWNARGQRDLDEVATWLSMQFGSTAAEPHIRNLARALRALDRQ